jgi:Phosphotransferase enzyme family
MADGDITPDDSLLTQIFTTNQPETISIFLQNWNKCVFKAEFPEGLEDRHSACVVRLEAENEQLQTFTTVAAMQQIAATIIPELVPQTLQVGKAKNAQGRTFHFSVTDFVEGNLLEDVWQQLSAEEQRAVVAELVAALEKLHAVQLSDQGMQEILAKTLRAEGDEVRKSVELPGIFGGPHTGFLNNGPALLDSIMERRKLKKPVCTMESIADSQDIRIQSSFEELGSIVIPNSDVHQWPGEAVLCHNDLNPRNLILHSRASAGGKSQYTLAGIIDWELAGFYPASYELSLQDTYLSGANRHVSFYLLLKAHMKNCVPRSPSQMVLLRAMELIFESQQRLLSDGTNIPAHIRKRFMEMARLARDSDPYVGWTRRSTQDGGPVPEYSGAAMQKLEDDVVEEMIARRKAKANRN